MPDKELTDERFEKLANKTLRFAGTQIFYCFVCKRKLSHPASLHLTIVGLLASHRWSKRMSKCRSLSLSAASH